MSSLFCTIVEFTDQGIMLKWNESNLSSLTKFYSAHFHNMHSTFFTNSHYIESRLAVFWGPNSGTTLFPYFKFHIFDSEPDDSRLQRHAILQGRGHSQNNISEHRLISFTRIYSFQKYAGAVSSPDLLAMPRANLSHLTNSEQKARKLDVNYFKCT